MSPALVGDPRLAIAGYQLSSLAELDGVHAGQLDSLSRLKMQIPVISPAHAGLFIFLVTQ